MVACDCEFADGPIRMAGRFREMCRYNRPNLKQEFKLHVARLKKFGEINKFREVKKLRKVKNSGK